MLNVVDRFCRILESFYATTLTPLSRRPFVVCLPLCTTTLKVEVTYWDEVKFNDRIFNDTGNDEMTQQAANTNGTS